MAAAPMSESDERYGAVDFTLVTVLAITWLAAVLATSLTLWLLVGVVGSS